MKPYAIFTACDVRYGEFLLSDWLTSLERHVDRTDIDVHVLDYGLSDQQRVALAARSVLCHPCVRDAHVANIRHRDLCNVLLRHPYEQVLSVDCGDIIFQSDISHLFDRNATQFRAVCEEVDIQFYENFMNRGDFAPEIYRQLLNDLAGKPPINAGVLFGPPSRFRTLWDMLSRCTIGLRYLGTDQLVLNYLCHRDGFGRLESGYNFVLLCMRSPWSIRSGVFCDDAGQPIPVVHNAGMTQFAKVIRNFGYGPQRNKRKWFAPLVTQAAIHTVRLWKWATQRWRA